MCDHSNESYKGVLPGEALCIFLGGGVPLDSETLTLYLTMLS